jgi:hypothetical protein
MNHVKTCSQGTAQEADCHAALLTALSLTWMLLAPGNAERAGAPCGSEARVSIELIGPQGIQSRETRHKPRSIISGLHVEAFAMVEDNCVVLS